MFEPKDDQSQKTVLVSRSYKVMTGLVIFVGGIILFWYLSHRDAEIAQRQKVVVGIIQTISRRGHGTATYEFQLDGKDYRGSEDHDPGFDLGQRVKVYVDPAHPNTNSLRDFRVNSETTHFVMMVFFWMSIGLAFILVIEMRNERAAR